MLRSLVGSEMCIRDSPWRPHLGTSGGLFGSVFVILSSLCYLRSSLVSLIPSPFSLLYSLFSLLSSLFSLLSSLFSLLSAIFSLLSPPVSLLSSLSALFPLLSLLLISQIELRTCHFELCIKPSIPLPIHLTLHRSVLLCVQRSLCNHGRHILFDWARSAQRVGQADQRALGTSCGTECREACLLYTSPSPRDS